MLRVHSSQVKHLLLISDRSHLHLYEVPKMCLYLHFLMNLLETWAAYAMQDGELVRVSFPPPVSPPSFRSLFWFFRWVPIHLGIS